MPIVNRAAELFDEIKVWRHDLHRRPELLFNVHETAAFIRSKLEEFGCDEVVAGIGRTGVVGIIRGHRGVGTCVGLRADMDALPLDETTGKPYASEIPGRMHACGHDGHTAMLLGAAKYLAETRNFAGSVAVIFQPAEEGGAGGREMVQDGLMERFGIRRVFGMHNLPGLPVGQFAIRPGPIMAATAEFSITVTGKGGHAAMPHNAVDPIVIAAHIVVALQTIASRAADPLESIVVSVTKVHGGHSHNIIPDEVSLEGTVRTLKKEMNALAEERIRGLAEGTAQAFGAEARVRYQPNYPVTVNDDAETEFAAKIACEVAGPDKVTVDVPPLMGGEDFSFMLEERPGAFIFIGNGDSAPLHNPAYDFNDEVIPYGVSYWIRLAEAALAAS